MACVAFARTLWPAFRILLLLSTTRLLCRCPEDPAWNGWIFSEMSGFTEGDGEQWRWFVPHDLPGLVELFGGADVYVAVSLVTGLLAKPNGGETNLCSSLKTFLLFYISLLSASGPLFQSHGLGSKHGFAQPFLLGRWVLSAYCFHQPLKHFPLQFLVFLFWLIRSLC